MYVVFGNINNVVFKIKKSKSIIHDRYLIHFRDLFDFFTHLFGVYRKTLYLCIGKLTIFNMKKHRIFIYAFIILLIIYYNWDGITKEHSIYQLLLCLLGIVFFVFLYISYILNWRETRPILVRVFEGCIYALFGILLAFASWNNYSVKGDIALSLFGAAIAFGSIVYSLISFFNLQKDRPKLSAIISIAVCVLYLISFLAFFILRIMSIQPVE